MGQAISTSSLWGAHTLMDSASRLESFENIIDAAFIPLRKPDKLPGETFKVSYTLEYGSTEMHIHKDALDNHKNLLIIDDLLATGGTALAAVDLIEMFDNKNIVGAGFIINLPDLNGDKKLQERGIKIHSLMDF